MKKLKLVEKNTLTFEEGCNKYLDNCRTRNLREGTINHYKQSYTQFFKFFDKDMLVSDINEKSHQWQLYNPSYKSINKSNIKNLNLTSYFIPLLFI